MFRDPRERILLVCWGALNGAIPVYWSTWLSTGIRDEPESGGGLLVGGIQLSIMTGGALGGLPLTVSEIRKRRMLVRFESKGRLAGTYAARRPFFQVADNWLDALRATSAHSALDVN